MKNYSVKLKIRNKIFRNEQGFSLIEIIIVVALITMLSWGGIKVFRGMRDTQVLNKVTNDVESVLNEARSQTLSALNSSVYGVHLEADKITLFKGDIFSSSDTSNEETVLDSSIGLMDISLAGGGSDVVFSRLVGDTDNDGTVTVYLISDSSKYRVITIRSTGVIEY